MKKILKAFLLLILAMTISVSLSGCKGSEEEKTNETVVVDTSKIIIKVYNVTDDKDEIKKIDIEENEQITIEKVVSHYIDEYAKLMADGDENVLNTVKAELPQITCEKKEDLIVVTLSDVLKNVGSGVEGNFIDNLAYSLVRNIEGVRGITLNVNGLEYASGHIIYELDEVVTGDVENNKK